MQMNVCTYLNTVDYSAPWAPCSLCYRHNSHYLYRPATGTGFSVTERQQSFRWQRRWLRQSSSHSNAVPPLFLHCPPSFCCLLLLLGWFGVVEEVAHQPQLCKHNWSSSVSTEGDLNLMQASITAHQVESGLKMDKGECWSEAKRERSALRLWCMRQGRALQC